MVLIYFRVARRARALCEGELWQRPRPAGIPNPRRRVPDLAAQPLGARPLSDLLDRKPHLLRPVRQATLAAACFDRRIDLKSMRTAEDCRQVRATVPASIACGEIAPA